jgi:tetratricopeptide (TPR) repeat protein/DNA-binding CsgD family transcriptional regulator
MKPLSMPHKYVYLLTFLVLSFKIAAQYPHQNNLGEKVAENGKLFNVNIDKAFVEIDGLLKDAVESKDSVLEMVLLDRICRYYYGKNDVNRLIEASDVLREKASAYKNATHRAMGHVYLAEAYSINKLSNKAINELDKAIAVLDQAHGRDAMTFYTRSNVLLSHGNIYNDMGEYRKAVEKIQEAIKSYPSTAGSNSFNKFQYINFSNLASTYLHFQTDSAAYYARQSIFLKPKNQPDDKIMSLNYYVLGKVSKTRNDIDEALAYFLKAEAIINKSGDLLNIEDLYQSIIDIYTSRSDSANIDKYRYKLNEYELATLQSKYNSLQKVISKKDEATVTWRDNTPGVLLFFIGFLVITTLIITYVKMRRRKHLPSFEDEPLTEEYDLLLDMIKRDDSSFIYTFEKLSPGFTKKLLGVCPQLAQTEIEFCALLKMKLSTKQIANLTFIETRTVQNKKHRIRKKLNIPADVDIYHWLDEF